ncbi:MAG: hypothetical protein MZW92_75265 [Comamonadaceae bacterium]|nr:hypothetical protein [Comamonadaceae bacterium]
MSVTMATLRDELGTVYALLSTERDLTEQLRFESEVRFRRLGRRHPRAASRRGRERSRAVREPGVLRLHRPGSRHAAGRGMASVPAPRGPSALRGGLRRCAAQPGPVRDRSAAASSRRRVPLDALDQRAALRPRRRLLGLRGADARRARPQAGRERRW